LIITIINASQMFDQVSVMTQGGPVDATNTIVYFIYQNGFQRFKMGYASATAWILFAIISCFTILQFKYQKQWVHYE
jgi:multiple sugar transport system permease protein